MKAKMAWATQNDSGTLTIQPDKGEAERVAKWGNGLVVKRVRLYS